MTTLSNVPKMLTIKQTAQETGLAEYFVRQLVKQGKVKCVYAGRKALINLDLFIDYLYGGDDR